MTTTSDAARLTWTPLGARMGFTANQKQREEILAAIEQMAWTKTLTLGPHLGGSAVRAIVTAVVCRNRHQIRFVGVAQLRGGRRLIGLQDVRGGRSYLLDLETEAIHVLVELPHLPATSHTQAA